MTRRARGFTLIEMMAVVLFTAITVTAVFRFHQDLTQSSRRATERTSESRRNASILDRVARDLGSAFLLQKREDEDPIGHPWVFYAEAQGAEEGADRLRFVSRGRLPRHGATHESDLEQVAYFLEPADDGSYDLLRWSSPQLGESLDTSIPGPDDDGSVVLAHDVAVFGVRFLPDEGEWVSEWNSATVQRSGELPVAVEIQVAVYGKGAGDFDAPEPEPFVRSVAIPVRPVSPEALQGDEEEDGEGDGEDDETDDGDCPGITVGECLALHPGVLPPEQESLVRLNAEQCFAEWAESLPQGLRAVAGDCE